MSCPDMSTDLAKKSSHKSVDIFRDFRKYCFGLKNVECCVLEVDLGGVCMFLLPISVLS